MLAQSVRPQLFTKIRCEVKQSIEVTYEALRTSHSCKYTSNRSWGSLAYTNVPSGDRIIVVVQKQRSFGPESGPNAALSISAANKVRRGDIRHAVVVRTAKKYQRPDGSVVKFDDNACVLINKAGDPIGSRLSGEFRYEVIWLGGD